MEINDDPRTIHMGRSLTGDGLHPMADLPLVDQILSLMSFETPPGSLQVQRTHEQLSESAEAVVQPKDVSGMRRCVISMLFSGSVVDFAGKTMYQILPGDDNGLSGLLLDKWLTAILTLGSFVACAFPPTLSKENRQATSAKMDFKFLTKLSVPSFVNLFVVLFRLVGLVFVAPAVVGILKNSVQMVSLALINKFQGKQLTRLQLVSMGGTMLGDVLIVCADVALSDGSKSRGRDASTVRQLIGIILVVLSGVFGAFRNAVEEMILVDYDFPSGALLMVESWVSAAISLILVIFMTVFNFSDSNLVDTLQQSVFTIPGAIVFVLFLITSYGREGGKLKVMKYTSGMVSKVLALVFPFGTW
eukprot:CAMPEP_0194496910 /NCGR_PEP_ID=MMETSP0253-20130528/14025_1 /TAXON_ID=2966 /ORGANISM="Noctiluca scintillans" /LENGTH=359 /DNA_ID=CAMNT_0039338363 /DNA_START=50 /DNA_END=1126 /DNA_ORIENTATION=+